MQGGDGGPLGGGGGGGLSSIFGGIVGGGGAGDGGTTTSVLSAHGREIARHLRRVLLDDEVQAVSTLDLNQFATYTYHAVELALGSGEDLLDVVVKTLGGVLGRRPLSQASHLSLLKSLAVLEWIIVHGSDRTIQETKELGRNVEALKEYNTVLLAHQSSASGGAGSISALALRIKGGGVDRGGPVRSKAERIVRLWTDPEYYRHQRSKHADPSSLVPVGSAQKLGFVTDEVRLRILRRRMEQEASVKSNLQKPEGGFGSGYNSRDGKSVVGAAHGIEEMLKRAERDKKRFVDESNLHGRFHPNDFAVPAAAAEGFSDYRAPTLLDEDTPAAGTLEAQSPPPPPLPEADLLGFGGEIGGGFASDGGNHPGFAAGPSSSFDEDLLGMGTPASASASSDPSSTLDLRDGGGASSSLSPSQPALSASEDWTMLMGTASLSAATTSSSMSTVVASNNNNHNENVVGDAWLGAAASTGRGPMAGDSNANPLFSVLPSTTNPTPSWMQPAMLSPQPLSTPGTESSLAGVGTMLGSMSLSPAQARKSTVQHATDPFAALDALAEHQDKPHPSQPLPPMAGGTSMGASSTSSSVGATSMGASSTSSSVGGGFGPGTNVAPGTSFAPGGLHPPPSAVDSPGGSWSHHHQCQPSPLSPGASHGGSGSGFLMGGSAGTGLFPLGPAPAAPPPPPPPSNPSPFSFF